MDLLPPTNTPRPAQINAALLILRIASSLAFLYHGSGILFGAFGGPGAQKFSAFMHMPLVGLAQVGSGLAILSGALIRLGAACIIVVMLGAIFFVHLPQRFDVGDVARYLGGKRGETLILGLQASSDAKCRVFRSFASLDNRPRSPCERVGSA